MSKSPFDTATTTTVLYLEPILNSYYKTYQNVLTLSNIPNGPLKHMVSTINLPKVSEFQNMTSPFYQPFHCAYVLSRYDSRDSGKITMKNNDYFMGADDIPSVFSYLQTNGYTIDTSLTKMLHHSSVVIGGVSDKRPSGNRRMICMFTYLS
jgi:hypothetical protein